MIYKSGKEVKEIYVGNTPVTSVYIGNQLVWRSYTYFKTNGISVFISLSDAKILKSHGITYSACNVVTLPIVSVSPYMRYIAPMLACSSEVGTISAFPNVFGAKLPKTIVNLFPISVLDISTHTGSIERTAGALFAVHSATIHGGKGDIMRPSHIIVSMQKTPIVAGTGICDRAMYTLNMLNIVRIEQGIGTISALRHGFEAIYNTPILEALGKPNGMRYTLNSVYRVHSINAEGLLDNGFGVFITLYKIAAMYGVAKKYNSHFLSGLTALFDIKSSKAPSSSFECISQSPSTAITEINSCKADIAFSNTEIALITSLSRAFIKLGTSKKAKADYSILTHEHMTLTSSTGMMRNTRHAALGFCSASMTTEVYTEPIQNYLDSTLITDMDELTVTGLDVMEIKI